MSDPSSPATSYPPLAVSSNKRSRFSAKSGNTSAGVGPSTTNQAARMTTTLALQDVRSTMTHMSDLIKNLPEDDVQGEKRRRACDLLGGVDSEIPEIEQRFMLKLLSADESPPTVLDMYINIKNDRVRRAYITDLFKDRRYQIIAKMDVSESDDMM